MRFIRAAGETSGKTTTFSVTVASETMSPPPSVTPRPPDVCRRPDQCAPSPTCPLEHEVNDSHSSEPVTEKGKKVHCGSQGRIFCHHDTSFGDGRTSVAAAVETDRPSDRPKDDDQARFECAVEASADRQQLRGCCDQVSSALHVTGNAHSR
ncbi:unnamed protein product [Soboliphyme baturini]|uniref:Uncharacterized protein n=1 Tax=Soboliphyme baturini TaxID=241478 RepID=A0A183IP47_9BILA|nr:unnamed protein product [Soboliphyme baturini]